MQHLAVLQVVAASRAAPRSPCAAPGRAGARGRLFLPWPAPPAPAAGRAAQRACGGHAAGSRALARQWHQHSCADTRLLVPRACSPSQPHHVHVPAVEPAERVHLVVRSHVWRVDQRPCLEQLMPHLQAGRRQDDYKRSTSMHVTRGTSISESATPSSPAAGHRTSAAPAAAAGPAAAAAAAAAARGLRQGQRMRERQAKQGVDVLLSKGKGWHSHQVLSAPAGKSAMQTCRCSTPPGLSRSVLPQPTATLTGSSAAGLVAAAAAPAAAGCSAGSHAMLAS